MRQALVWAREKVHPALSVTAMAAKLDLKRTTYDSMERGTGRITVEILDQVGDIRGLPRNWYRDFEKNIPVDKGLRYTGLGTVALSPTVLVPNSGYLTRADLRSDPMILPSEPIQVPSNMALPNMRAAIADADDTMPEFEEGTALLFEPLPLNPSAPPKIGKKVAVKLPNRDGLSLRELAWDGERVVLRSMRDIAGIRQGKSPTEDVTRNGCDIQGVLVGWITDNDINGFHAKFKRDGI